MAGKSRPPAPESEPGRQFGSRFLRTHGKPSGRSQLLHRFAADNRGVTETAQRPSRLRTFLGLFVAFVLGVGSGIGGVALWATNRYIVDEVAIADVAAFEAQLQSESGFTLNAEEGITTEVVTGDDELAAASIEITTEVVGEGSDQITYFVADIQLDDVTQLRGGFANNQFGRSIVADPSEIADDYDASFAINGDYYGFRDTGIVIRNGVLFRDEPARGGLAIYRDGTMKAYDETATSGQELIDDGVWITLSFGPALLEDGEVIDGIEDVEVDTNMGRRTIQGTQPRTGVGMISPNHFVFIVVDGRSRGYSRGVTMTEFAQIFQSLGAQVAYNIDGGGSATMVSEGELVNDPLGKGNERETSDILYVG